MNFKTMNDNFFDLKALSVNKAWKGQRFKTADYNQFERDFMWLLKAQRFHKYKGAVSIIITYYFSSVLSDVDNPTKMILDTLTKNGNIEDDRYVYDLRVIKKLVDDKEGFEIYITSINDLIDCYDTRKKKVDRQDMAGISNQEKSKMPVV